MLHLQSYDHLTTTEVSQSLDPQLRQCVTPIVVVLYMDAMIVALQSNHT